MRNQGFVDVTGRKFVEESLPVDASVGAVEIKAWHRLV